MLQIFPTDHASALVLRVSGDVTPAQNAAADGVIARLAREHGSVSLLLDLTEVDTIDPAALRESAARAVAEPHRLRRVAVLGDGPWADEVEALARTHTRARVRRYPRRAPQCRARLRLPRRVTHP